MDTDPIHIQIDQIIGQRIGELSHQYINIQAKGQAAVSLLLDLGPAYPGEIQERRIARGYLEEIAAELAPRRNRKRE